MKISNYPNPFNLSDNSRSIAATTISFNLPLNDHVEVAVYNLKGQKIKTLLNEYLKSGEQTVEWNGENKNGEKVSSGVYLYKVETSDWVESRKLLLVK